MFLDEASVDRGLKMNAELAWSHAGPLEIVQPDSKRRRTYKLRNRENGSMPIVSITASEDTNVCLIGGICHCDLPLGVDTASPHIETVFVPKGVYTLVPLHGLEMYNNIPITKEFKKLHLAVGIFVDSHDAETSLLLKSKNFQVISQRTDRNRRKREENDEENDE